MMRCGKCKKIPVELEHVRECHNLVDHEGRPQAVKPSAMAKVDVPDGRYALVVNGVVVFYKVDRPTKGRWNGYTFVNQLLGAPGDYTRKSIKNRVQRDEILAAIALDTPAALRRYGIESGHCGHCGAMLSDPESLARGIGPVCIKSSGWASYFSAQMEAV